MSRRRWTVLLVVCLVVVGAAAAYLIGQSARVVRPAEGTATVAVRELGGVLSEPRLYVRNTALGAGYGQVAVVPLADTRGPRALLGVSCDRLAAVATRSLCVSADRGVVTTYRAVTGDPAFGSPAPLTLVGFSSRARLSDDGALASTTTFVSGDSYLAQGFSTRVFVTDLRTGAVAHLEDFALLHEGTSIVPVDRNYWGVTFAADDRTFYVTVAWAGQTWLGIGDLATRTVRTLADNVECPSLSPDGTRVAFKRRVGPASDPWRVMVRDLATGAVTEVAEARSVDDQVLWLDDRTLAYALPRGAPGLATSDVWSVPADGSGAPSVLVADAFSPAVVR